MSATTAKECTFTHERDVFRPEGTTAYYRHRKALHGWLKFEGIEFHAFVGNMIRVTNYRGDHYLVDRWGGIWEMRGSRDIRIIKLDPRPVRKDVRSGYGLGLWAIAYDSV